MAPRFLLIVPTLFLVAPASSQAGPHLGMKLACRDYGQAWTERDRAALMSAATPGFAAVWASAPDDVLTSLPRTQGSPRIVTSQKSGNTGTVTLARGGQVFIFQMVGGGFDWKVDDIHHRQPTGQLVSLRDRLDSTIAVRRFVRSFGEPSDHSFTEWVSADFRLACRQLERGRLDLVRDSFPETGGDLRSKFQPIQENRANLVVTLPGKPTSRTVTFRLVREDRWKVDNFQFEGAALEIHSYRDAMPALASLAALSKFAEDSRQVHPHSFTAEGSLREELLAFHESGGTMGSRGKRDSLRFTEDHANAHLDYPRDRDLRVQFSKDPQSLGKIETASVHVAGQWRDLANVLAFKRKISGLRNLSMDILFAGLRRRVADSDLLVRINQWRRFDEAE